MIYVIGSKEELSGNCEYCGKYDELRPYGKNGAKICYECGMKDEEETDKNMTSILFPETIKPEQNN